MVLKRVKSKVQGAEEMHEAEHMINVLATKAAGEAVAPFIGYTMVDAPVGAGTTRAGLRAGAAAPGGPVGPWLRSRAHPTSPLRPHPALVSLGGCPRVCGWCGSTRATRRWPTT